MLKTYVQLEEMLLVLTFLFSATLAAFLVSFGLCDLCRGTSSISLLRPRVWHVSSQTVVASQKLRGHAFYQDQNLTKPFIIVWNCYYFCRNQGFLRFDLGDR